MLEISSAGNASDNVKTLDTFFTILSVPCPPVDSLHFVCNHKIGDPRSTCEERALIINKCLHQFPGLYNNSQWSLCLMDVCKCEAVLNVLRNNDFINKSDDDAESVTVTTITVSTTLSTSNLTTSSITSAVSSQSTSITTSITTSSDTTSGSSESVSPMDDGSETPSSADGELNTVSYIYPIIGAFLIAFEIVMLCAFSCYKKKREHNANAVSII
ncbi:uncharacterized protein LOC132728912 isoform X2 [Ruditapes philippinarum]|uniref:uncharacterized protein LOC132728912 isoform X2 n=1 Tax=Ruditapes philippinarum TaxID=129788 RepID=UPI00295BF5CB|nr:uncharacterized protein LOC132728912 isoform X2 [Ruditapes philippinarum]